MKKYVFVKAHDTFKVGDEVELSAEHAVPLLNDGLVVTATEYAASQALIKAKKDEKDVQINRVKAAIVTAKGQNKIKPKDETVEAKYLGLLEKGSDVELILEAINALPVEKNAALLTTRAVPGGEPGRNVRIDIGEEGLEEVIKGCLEACAPEYKERASGGLFVKAHNAKITGKSREYDIGEAVGMAKVKASRFEKLADLIAKGANFRFTEDLVKAALDPYADPAGALGVLNTGLTLQWNLGHLENQLIMLNDITTDISNTPVLFQQVARTRYIQVPGVMLKTLTNNWTTNAGPGNDVDVNIVMSNYAGVPLTINEYVLGTTSRQLFNEQQAPQLYGLGEYVLYTLINNIINGNTRIANNGTSTSTIKFNPVNWVDPTLNVNTAFDVAGATLATFVASLPAALDIAKFPGGDEPDGSALARFAWVHTSLYSQVAQDTNFLLNQSIQGISQNRGENTIRTGTFTQIGNLKFRKSQLMSDQIGTNGTGADGGPNALTVTPGAYTNAAIVGMAGTRSSLLFVSRAPLDYTKVMPEIPSTAAIEIVASPKMGITFMVVKYLDHGYENANMRVQLMWGTGIGDERQGMYLRQK